MLQIPNSACSSASVELKTLENGDRAEFYKWEFEIPGSENNFERDFGFPTPAFEDGLFSNPSWIQNFRSSFHSNGIVRLEIPCPISRPDDGEDIVWEMAGVPELHFIYRKSYGEDPTVLMNFSHGDWKEGSALTYRSPAIPIPKGKNNYDLERLRISMKMEGKSTNQQTSSSPSAALYNNSEFSDIVLLCQGETFYCHKIILSVASPVFKQMLASDAKEAKDGRVEIEDADKDVLTLMLEWMYGLNIHPKLKNLQLSMDLLKLADRYLVDSLKAFLAKRIVTNVTAENAFEIYTLGEACREEKLKAKATEIMKRNRGMFANDEFFDECHRRFPKLLQEICKK